MTQTYRGKSRYTPDLDEGQGKLFVAVKCFVAEFAHPLNALLDTAGEWCVLPPHLADVVTYEPVSDEIIRLHTRYGLLTGKLIRAAVVFAVQEGVPVIVDATWFLPDEWPGPVVIGWKGCLERMRFGLDPADDSFYFGDPTS